MHRDRDSEMRKLALALLELLFLIGRELILLDGPREIVIQERHLARPKMLAGGLRRGCRRRRRSTMPLRVPADESENHDQADDRPDPRRLRSSRRVDGLEL